MSDTATVTKAEETVAAPSVEELLAENASLKAQVVDLQERLARLRAGHA